MRIQYYIESLLMLIGAIMLGIIAGYMIAMSWHGISGIGAILMPVCGIMLAYTSAFFTQYVIKDLLIQKE